VELKELRQLAPEELRLREQDVREELLRLRLKLRTNQLDNPASCRQARRNLARVKTLLREKELARPGAPVEKRDA
jgi:large subunit ribosomal protein L29